MVETQMMDMRLNGSHKAVTGSDVSGWGSRICILWIITGYFGNAGAFRDVGPGCKVHGAPS